MVSRSGVLLNAVTAIFQFCMSEREVRRELGFAHSARSEEPDWLALAAVQIVQCDFHHLRRLPPVPVNFSELFEALAAAPTRGMPTPKAHRAASFTPKPPPKPTRPGCGRITRGGQA